MASNGAPPKQNVPAAVALPRIVIGREAGKGLKPYDTVMRFRTDGVEEFCKNKKRNKAIQSRHVWVFLSAPLQAGQKVGSPPPPLPSCCWSSKHARIYYLFLVLC